MKIYLDNAATTKVMDEIIDKTIDMYKKSYGNPSSLHNMGLEAEKEITKAKEIIAKALRVNKNDIYFTSGGTEGNNIGILGSVLANKKNGKHIITSVVEHHSVISVYNHLEQKGYEVTRINCDKNGVVDLEELENSIRNDTILVSIMHVNNEVGTIMPIEKIGKLIKEKNHKTLFHVDGVQSFCKLDVFPEKYNIDTLSISGHKIYAPKGVGILYIKNPNRIKPITYGGSHQNGIRPGTENVAAIAGLGISTEKLYAKMNENQEHYRDLKNYLIKKLKDTTDDFKINGYIDNINESAAHIINISFNNVKGEVLLHSLESKEIYVSTGSACSSKKKSKSPTLKDGLKLDDKTIEEAIRISFSIYNTFEDIDCFVEALNEIIPNLRRFIRK